MWSVSGISHPKSALPGEHDNELATVREKQSIAEQTRVRVPPDLCTRKYIGLGRLIPPKPVVQRSACGFCRRALTTNDIDHPPLVAATANRSPAYQTCAKETGRHAHTPSPNV